MCGIFGYSGKKPVNLAKMKLLGVYNVSRGRNSCGYYYNGELRHGVGKQSEWTDFITDGMLVDAKAGKGGRVFIGHTRAATVGAHTIENAHPFKVDNYVQAHNGTLENAFELCEKYGIDHKKEKINVDSLGLAHLIKKQGWGVLDEYVGYAALLMHFENEPNSIYVYHGASKTEPGKGDFIERPLFYMEGKDEIYFSSLEDSLLAIRDVITQEPISLTCNKVYKFTNGVLDEIVYEVSRSLNNLNFLAKKSTPFVPTSVKNYPAQRTLFNTKELKKSGIWDELQPPEADDSKKTFYWKGRHWKTIVTGAHHVHVLLNGKVSIARGGDIVEMGTKHERPVDDFYFMEGVMLKNAKAYRNATKDADAKNKGLSIHERRIGNFAFYISEYSKYPVTSLETEGNNCADDLRFRWYINKQRFTGVITARFTKRSYEIVNGVLDVVRRPDTDKVFAKKSEAPVVPLNNTPVILDSKTPVIIVEDDDKEKEEERNKLKNEAMKCFHMPLASIDELQDMPDTVYAAIEVYIDEKNEDDSIIGLLAHEREEYYQSFMISAVNKGISLYAAIDSFYSDNLPYYIDAAIIRLEKEAKKEADKSAIQIGATAADVDKAIIDLKPISGNELELLNAKLRKMEQESKANKDAEEDVDDESIHDFDSVDDFVESEQARKQFDEVITMLEKIASDADKLQALENSDLAQNMAFVLYNTIGQFKESAKEAFDREPKLLEKTGKIGELPF